MVKVIQPTRGAPRAPLKRNVGEVVQSRWTGFSLPEVLVVIGILAVLSGVLLPAVSNARRVAATTKCLSNLRQVGIAFQEYAAYWNGKFPVATHQPVSHMPRPFERRWGDMLGEFVSGTPMEKAEDLGLDRNSVLWGCPEWPKSVDFDPTSVNDRLKSGYGMNYWPSFFEDSDTRKLAYITGTWGSYDLQSQWTKPSDRILVADSTEHAISTPNSFSSNGKWSPYNSTASINAFYVEPRHGRRGLTKRQSYYDPCLNALFCDFHVQTISVRDAWNAIHNPGQNKAAD